MADFGLSETVDPCKDYFRQDSADVVKLPVKWLAPKCLSDGVFPEKSDVVSLPSSPLALFFATSTRAHHSLAQRENILDQQGT